jgi:hypothetical protein
MNNSLQIDYASFSSRGDEWFTELLKAEDVIPSHTVRPTTVPGARVALRINTQAGSDNKGVSFAG